MRAPLTVRINDGSTDRLVSQRITGLRFRKSAPGGHADASCRIDVPRSTFTNLGPADRMWIYDNQARTIWEGCTNNPGAQGGRAGEGFELSALGGMSLASDTNQALVYIDRTTEKWFRSVGVAPSATADATDDPDGTDATVASATHGIKTQFVPGQPIGAGSRTRMSYHALDAANMQFGAAFISIRSGRTDVNFDTKMYWNDLAGTYGDIPISLTTGIDTTARNSNSYVVTNIPAGARAVGLGLVRSGGATNVASDDIWSYFYNIAILGRRMDRFGNLASGAAGMVTNQYVRADWVVEDMLGRVLTFCDPNTSTVAATAYQIDQLAYHDGVKAAQVFDDLMVLEPDFLWEILEANTAGKFRFNWRAWPTTPRYVIPPSLNVEQPGGDVDLCNRIAVNWTDVKGNAQVTIVTSTVPELGTRTRDADPVTLPEGRGSLANAQRLGAQILATKAAPPRAARVTVDRPIVDLTTGTQVWPWEIEPGYLVRIQSTGEDLRLTEIEYDDDSCSSDLSLGEPVLTFEQRVARLEKAA